jgi:hypothetical protein
MTIIMPNKDHFVYKNSIFKIFRPWEHSHFVDILGSKHFKNTW